MKSVNARLNVVMNKSVNITFIIVNEGELIREVTIAWRFEPINSSISSSNLSHNGLSLKLSSAQLHHRGTYKITVSNPAGNTTATTDLDVFGMYM